MKRDRNQDFLDELASFLKENNYDAIARKIFANELSIDVIEPIVRITLSNSLPEYLHNQYIEHTIQNINDALTQLQNQNIIVPSNEAKYKDFNDCTPSEIAQYIVDGYRAREEAISWIAASIMQNSPESVIDPLTKQAINELDYEIALLKIKRNMYDNNDEVICLEDSQDLSKKLFEERKYVDVAIGIIIGVLEWDFIALFICRSIDVKSYGHESALQSREQLFNAVRVSYIEKIKEVNDSSQHTQPKNIILHNYNQNTNKAEYFTPDKKSSASTHSSEIHEMGYLVSDDSGTKFLNNPSVEVKDPSVEAMKTQELNQFIITALCNREYKLIKDKIRTGVIETNCVISVIENLDNELSAYVLNDEAIWSFIEDIKAQSISTNAPSSIISHSNDSTTGGRVSVSMEVSASMDPEEIKRRAVAQALEHFKNSGCDTSKLELTKVSLKPLNNPASKNLEKDKIKDPVQTFLNAAKSGDIATMYDMAKKHSDQIDKHYNTSSAQYDNASSKSDADLARIVDSILKNSNRNIECPVENFLSAAKSGDIELMHTIATKYSDQINKEFIHKDKIDLHSYRLMLQYLRLMHNGKLNITQVVINTDLISKAEEFSSVIKKSSLYKISDLANIDKVVAIGNIIKRNIICDVIFEAACNNESVLTYILTCYTDDNILYCSERLGHAICGSAFGGHLSLFQSMIEIRERLALNVQTEKYVLHEAIWYAAINNKINIIDYILSRTNDVDMLALVFCATVTKKNYNLLDIIPRVARNYNSTPLIRKLFLRVNEIKKFMHDKCPRSDFNIILEMSISYTLGRDTIDAGTGKSMHTDLFHELYLINNLITNLIKPPFEGKSNDKILWDKELFWYEKGKLGPILTLIKIINEPETEDFKVACLPTEVWKKIFYFHIQNHAELYKSNEGALTFNIEVSDKMLTYCIQQFNKVFLSIE